MKKKIYKHYRKGRRGGQHYWKNFGSSTISRMLNNQRRKQEEEFRSNKYKKGTIVNFLPSTKKDINETIGFLHEAIAHEKANPIEIIVKPHLITKDGRILSDELLPMTSEEWGEIVNSLVIQRRAAKQRFKETGKFV